MAAGEHIFELIIDDITYYGVIHNWREIYPGISRNERYRVNLAAFSLDQIELVEEAKSYIDNQVEEKGLHATGTIIINIWNQNTNSYELYLSGDLDYNQHEYVSSEMSRIGLKPVSLVTKWLANDDVEVALQDLKDLEGNDITPFTNETIDVQMPEADLFLFFQGENGDDYVEIVYETGTADGRGWQGTAETAGTTTGTTSTKIPTTLRKVFQIGTDKINQNDLPESVFQLPSAPIPDGASPSEQEAVADLINHAGPEKEFYGIKIEYDIDYELYRDVEPDGFSDSKVEILLAKGIDTGILAQEQGTNIILYWERSPDSDQNFDFAGNISGTIQDAYTFDTEGYARYYIECASGGQSLAGVSFKVRVNKWKVTVEKKATYPATTHKFIPPWEMFVRLAQKITGIADPVRSNYYGRTDGELYQYEEDGQGSLVFVTNGLQVRQFPIDSNPIVSSFYQAFKIYNSLHNIGIGVIEEEGTKYLAIEPIEYFHQTGTPAFTITEPSDYSERQLLSEVFSDFKCGYTKYEKQENGTLVSSHTKRVYTTELSGIYKNSLDLQCEAIASGYVLELTRRDPYIGEFTKDSQYDNDLFLLQVKRSGGGFVPEEDDTFDAVSGLADNALLYNLNLLPVRRIVKRHLNIINISNIKSTLGFIRFQSGTGNVNVNTRRTGEETGIDEDISYSPNDPPLYFPTEVSCKYPISRDELNSLLSNPNSTLNLIRRGVTKEYFIDQVKINNLDSKEADFILKPVYTP